MVTRCSDHEEEYTAANEHECTRIRKEQTLPSDHFEFVNRYSQTADAILLDSCREGGSGELADLATCAEIVRSSPLPVFLAGGLNAANVADAIRLVRPFGVDVETGVSVKVPGCGMLKSLQKCYEFLDAVARLDRQLLRDNAILNKGATF
jgi:phosphoribosylanthranilate isomerase